MLRKRLGAYVRIVRCTAADCRVVTVLWPTWAAVGADGTLDEIEAVVEAREEHPQETWRQSAERAGQKHRPSTFRRWVRGFGKTMVALLPRLPALCCSGAGGWIRQLRAVFGVTERGVLGVVRAHLLTTAELLLGPLDLFPHVRSVARPPPSP